MSRDPVILRSNANWARVRKLYRKDKHSHAFPDADAFANWWVNTFLDQEGRCSYCGVSAELLGELIDTGLLHGRSLQGQNVRRFLETDRTASRGKYQKQNCSLVCCYCNNDKSNIYTDEDYRQYFAPARTRHFQELAKRLALKKAAGQNADAVAPTSSDYRKYYNLEKYLFEEVGPRFRAHGELPTLDFLAILVWKSNRAKTKHKQRLAEIAGTIDIAVEKIRESLRNASSDEDQFRHLIVDWKFRLPTASAIMSVLKPDVFTVYDYRACEVLGEFTELEKLQAFASIWEGYKRFVQAVRDRTPRHFSLRDKDRFLWGMSFHKDLERLRSGVLELPTIEAE